MVYVVYTYGDGNKIYFQIFEHITMSLMYKLISNRSRMEPCGSPQNTYLCHLTLKAFPLLRIYRFRLMSIIGKLLEV